MLFFAEPAWCMGGEAHVSTFAMVILRRMVSGYCGTVRVLSEYCQVN